MPLYPLGKLASSETMTMTQKFLFSIAFLTLLPLLAEGFVVNVLPVDPALGPIFTSTVHQRTVMASFVAIVARHYGVAARRVILIFARQLVQGLRNIGSIPNFQDGFTMHMIVRDGQDNQDNQDNEDNEDCITVLPPDSQMMCLGLSTEQIETFPEAKAYDDKAGYAATETARKGLVGSNGTDIQLVEYIEVHGIQFAFGQALLFLLKNRLKPTLLDVWIIASMILQFSKVLSQGNAAAVNRRAELIAQGILNPQGDDVVPGFVRDEWLALQG